MRQITRFNTDWKFHRGDLPEAWKPDWDDRAWRSVLLPHDWSIEGPFDPKWASATGYLPGGIGWYRRTFHAPPGADSGNTLVQFDGVYCNSAVWMNGHSLGTRPSGFASFEYNLTPYLHVDGPNVLAVRVDHSQFGDARWYTGSGINRNVRLITVPPVHLKTWGIGITTPNVSQAQADAAVEVIVQNQAASAADIDLHFRLLDPDGKSVAEESSSLALSAGSWHSVAETLTVDAPRLWSPEQPHLYTLRTEVHLGEEVIDALETPVGIREFRFDPDTGFFLNGQNTLFKGVCLHDDAGALGTAVPPAVWERRLQTLKAAGVNAIRMAHNPHMPELYDLCDRLGFLVQDEAFDEWELGKNKWIAGWNVGKPGKDGPHAHFAEWGEADLKDMIRQNRNHPSIVMWSIGNEIDYPNDPYTHEVMDTGTNPQSYGRGFQPDRPHSSRLGEVARQLAAWVREADPTRPVTAAISAAIISNETGFCDALDVVGYNYQEPRYPEDHAKYPSRVLYGSENGMAWSAWQAVSENPYISGQFLWTGIDYLGEAHGWPVRSNGAGLMDLAGLPKPEWHFRRSLWAAEPGVYLGTCPVPTGEEAQTLWTHRQAEPVWRGIEGQMVRVQCFTSCDAAELLLNGRSLGIREMTEADGHVLWWDVPYAPGTLTVRGLKSALTVCTDTLQTSGPAQKLHAEADRITVTADGIDLAHIVVSVADADGVPVYGADHDITWDVSGPARLLGLESGDPASHEDYKVPHRRAYHGRLLGYVQSTETAGELTITLSTPGLEPAEVRLTTV